MVFSNKLIKILVLLFLFGSASAYALDPIYTAGYFSNKAVDGHDVVAYFSQSKPVKGSSKYTFKYKGADWYFSSKANLDKFKKNPTHYAPQYGGYCAYAMSLDKIAPGNAPFWTIYKKKLYLNFDGKAQLKWRAHKDMAIKLANVHWAKKIKK